MWKTDLVGLGATATAVSRGKTSQLDFNVTTIAAILIQIATALGAMLKSRSAKMQLGGTVGRRNQPGISFGKRRASMHRVTSKTQRVIPARITSENISATGQEARALAGTRIGVHWMTMPTPTGRQDIRPAALVEEVPGLPS